MVGHDKKPNTSFTSGAQTWVTSKNPSQIHRSVLELQRVHDSGESEKERSWDDSNDHNSSYNLKSVSDSLTGIVRPVRNLLLWVQLGAMSWH
jgi:hypothetical protein